MFSFKKDKSTQMTMPEPKMVHGIEVKKVPVGQYIKAMKQMEDLPRVIVEECFPGKSMAEVLGMFTSADEGAVVTLLGKLLVVLPEHIVDALCSIMGLDGDIVMNNLTPKELLDVLKAYWQLNDMSDFFKGVWGLIKGKLPTLTTGFKNGSPLEKASV